MGFSILSKLELETGKSRRKARREIIVFWQLAGLASCPKKKSFFGGSEHSQGDLGDYREEPV